MSSGGSVRDTSLTGWPRSGRVTHQRGQAQLTEKPLVEKDNGIFLTFVIKKILTSQQKINAGILGLPSFPTMGRLLSSFYFAF